MDYQFDELIERSGTDSIKWDTADRDVLPMWIADMDFKTAPAIQAALQARAAHGVFGYTQTPKRFFDAIIGWWEKRHGYLLHQDWIRPVGGVIPALSATIRALTAEGAKVMVQPPVYNHFYIAIAHCGCEVVENNLCYRDGNYQVDFSDLETKAADPAVKLLLLCNPHNPVGRAWTAEELRRIGEICYRHQVVVLSDEIHSDLVYEGHKHVPFAALGNINSLQSITVSSPSKTFNLAGLQVGYLFSENLDFRKQIQQVLAKQEMVLLNPFAIEALIAAYEQGEPWLEALKVYLADNFDYLLDFCSTHLPQVQVVPLQATYLVWLDCRSITATSEAFADKLVREQRLWLNPGTTYGDAGAGFLRVNIACPRSVLEEGLIRLVRGCRAATQSGHAERG